MWQTKNCFEILARMSIFKVLYKAVVSELVVFSKASTTLTFAHFMLCPIQLCNGPEGYMLWQFDGKLRGQKNYKYIIIIIKKYEWIIQNKIHYMHLKKTWDDCLFQDDFN